MAGGNSGGIESYLPIAAALAATVATDGAASPWLVESMGATAAGALTSGAAAAAASGLTAAVTGQDVGRSALTGAVTGGIGGALAGYNAAATVPGATAAPLTGANVAGTAAIPVGDVTSQIAPNISSMVSANPGNMDMVSQSLQNTYGMTANQANAAIAQNMAGTGTANGINMATANAADKAAGIASNIGPSTVSSAGGSGVGNWLSNNKGVAALGGTALLGAMIQNDNKKYGTPATETYDGPLSDFHYDRTKYTPLTTPQPNPPYKPVYPNYVKNPYNAYAAQGGRVVAMAEGGIAGTNPSVGPVEEMSRLNATGNNQMFPQAAINSDAFSNATNRPLAQNMVSGISDTAIDPYTGAQRFAEGGATQTPADIPLQAMPNFITQNSVATNNALTQDLVSRLAARNAANPVPGQTPPVTPMQPAGIMAAAPYSAPTFTRSTPAPIEFQNPKAILGTKAYNDEQARLAAEAAAAENANRFMSNPAPSGDHENYGASAAGGLMPDALRYAMGGGVESHLGGYSDGGRLLKGPGDGMSDNIPATIGRKQPARLADGEFVIPADVVSHLGNGSTDAGAKHLYAMMDKVRKARTGNKKQGKQIKPAKYLKA